MHSRVCIDVNADFVGKFDNPKPLHCNTGNPTPMKEEHLLPGTDYFYIPQCQDCKIECHSLVYHAYNSYGKGFSHGALKWLNRKNSSWSNAHMRYFTCPSDICNVSGDIGGNMGMFLGMSLITVTEVSLFISKIGWIAFSKRRRDYLYNKKKSEKVVNLMLSKEREKQLEETVSGFNMFRIKKVADVRDSFRVTQSRLRAFGKKMRDSFRVSKPKGLNAPPLYTSVSHL
uniref:Amiloride-sensitive sodium channel n=1 Tax=Angiostrongylus cantonensis TaxID=6313 RepID=A0A0K0DHI7_ANGCA